MIDPTPSSTRWIDPNLQCHQYADDTVLYKTLSANHPNSIIETTQQCIIGYDLKSWKTIVKESFNSMSQKLNCITCI